jgi:uncharacterized protein YfaS (alpha-2-macroglobulin family)
MRSIRGAFALASILAVALSCVDGRRHVDTVAPRPPSTPPIASPPSSTAAQPAHRPAIAFDVGDRAGKLVLRPNAATTSAQAIAPAVELSAAETAALLARLEPLPDVSVAPPKTMRAPSPPPPRAGAVVPIGLAPPGGASVPDAPVAPPAMAKPLAEPQITPTGQLPREAEIRVRFDEPMVPVAALGDTQTPPVQIDPPIAGTWRWLDTRMLVFAPTAARLPQATEFTVTVPAGTRAVSGATLAAPTSAQFRTAPTSLSHVSPRLVRPDSALAIVFDQAVDLAAVRPFVRLVGERNEPLAFDVVDLDAARARWAKNPSLDVNGAMANDFGPRTLYVVPRGAWRAASRVRVVLAKGAPSKEGPLVATVEVVRDVEVVPAFAAVGVRCTDAEPRMTGARCPAKDWLAVELATAIAEHSFRSKMIQIEGQPFEDHKASGASVVLTVPDAVGKTFAITIADGLVDIYGQPYVGAHRLTFETLPQRWDALVEASTGLVVLDPRFAIPQWVVRADAIERLHVELYRVAPADYFAFAAAEEDARKPIPGKRVFDRVYDVGARRGAIARVDLRGALAAGGTGHVVAIATPLGARGRDQRRLAWIEVTRLAVSARVDGDRARAWVSSIAPDQLLAPVPDARVALAIRGAGDGATATSDAEGRADFALPPPPPGRDDKHPAPPALLVATRGDDTAFVPIDGYERAQRHADARWYVTDDRFTYKPGETVYVKGWVRWSHDGVDPDLALPKVGDAVAWTLSDRRGVRIASGTAPLSDRGGFDLSVALPDNANLGTAQFTLSTGGAATSHPIAIQEFRTPAYMVSLDDDVAFAGATPLVLGESIDMRVEAKYYAGGGLPGAGIHWAATLEPAAYRPPGWDGYSFEPSTYERRRRYDRPVAITTSQDDALSGQSTAGLAIDIAALPDDAPAVLSVDATVADIDRMHIRASSRRIVVHPSDYYVGLRGTPGTESSLDAIVADVDGNAVRGVAIEIDVVAVLGSERWRDDANVVDRQHCTVTSDTAPTHCKFARGDIKWAYTATARVVDRRGRANRTAFAIPWWSASDVPRDFAVVPDKETYRVGDTAALTIHSRVVPATAIVSIARQGVVEQRRVELARETTRVEVAIAPQFLPNVHVVVDRFARQATPRDAKQKPLPEHLQLSVDLPVDIESARLEMTTRPRRAIVGPGEQATFDVDVKKDGKPVAGAEVALIVVDEAVLALSTRSFYDPLPGFFRRVADGTRALSSLHDISDSTGDLDGAPGFERYSLDEVGRMGYGVSGHGYGGGGSGSFGGGVGTIGAVRARKNFNANAAFAPRLHTDANGRATLVVTMPDNLTRYRVVALAAADNRFFGKAESSIVARRDLSVRVVAPRFVTQGDTFWLPVVVQNLGTTSRTIDVAARAANLVSVGGAGKRVVVPPGQRAELRFELKSAARGKAAIQTIAVSGDRADAMTIQVPVYVPATTEAFAVYGTVAEQAPQFEQLVVPKELFRDVGGVEVELASTQLQSLTDAYWYLHAYPYECAEQRSSRMLATAAIYDVLAAFVAVGQPDRDEIDAQAKLDVSILARTQNADGGWGYFRGMESNPFVTMQVVTALAATKQPVPTNVRAAGVAYVEARATALLAKLHRRAAKPPASRDREDSTVDVDLAATGLAALAATGKNVRARVDQLDADARALASYPIDAKARVLALVAGVPAEAQRRAKLVAELLAATHETAGSATVTASYVEAQRLLLVSTTSSTALALDALLREVPQHAVVAKLARGLLDTRKRGRWRNTHDNLDALRALRRYFDVYEKDTPAFAAKAWLGGAGYAEHAFAGRSRDRATARVGWTELAPGSTHDLAFQRDGTGRLYYRVGIVYAPARVDLPALDAGFVVRRSYTAVDDPKDVSRGSDGRWHVRLGARVVVAIEATNTTKRYDVALVDPLPAGFEVVNSALAVAERPVVTHTQRWDYENLRDERAEAFARELGEGTHVFAYTARATTPGTFVAAPSKAEEMYAPETFGRSRGEVVVVE